MRHGWWGLMFCCQVLGCAAFSSFHLNPPWPSLSSPCVQLQLLDPECELVVVSFCDAEPGLPQVYPIHNASARFDGTQFPFFNVCMNLCPVDPPTTNHVQVMCANQWNQNQVVAWRPASSPACPLALNYQYQEPTCLDVWVRFSLAFDAWMLDPSLQPRFSANGTTFLAKYTRHFNESLLFVFMPAGELFTGCGPLTAQIGFTPTALQHCFQPSAKFSASFPSDDRAAMLVCWTLVYQLFLWGHWYGWWRTYSNLGAAVNCSMWYTSLVAMLRGGLSVLVWGEIFGLVGLAVLLGGTLLAYFLRRGTTYARFPSQSFNERNTFGFLITVTMTLGLLATLPVIDSLV
jgi:hypothetical protein